MDINEAIFDTTNGSIMNFLPISFSSDDIAKSCSKLYKVRVRAYARYIRITAL